MTYRHFTVVAGWAVEVGNWFGGTLEKSKFDLLGDITDVRYTGDAVDSERFRRIRDTLERIVQVRRNLAMWENLDTYLDSITRVGDRRLEILSTAWFS